jgi:rare lipoprotein A
MVMSNLHTRTRHPLQWKQTGLHLLVLLAVLTLNACTSSSGDSSATSDGNSNSGRYALKNDAPPDGDTTLDPDNIPDAVPVDEPRTASGNKSPYTVLGETYTVMPESSGYAATGKASWYGKKFHGYKTSNGEIFDMYKMSAAHRTLPIPSYVRVTNLANGRSGIVRVNDRGPFHSERIMDLSYAAAVKLDMVRTGTAKVKIEVIDPSTHTYAAREADSDELERPAKKTTTSSTSTKTVTTKAVTTAAPRATSVADGSAYLQAGAFRSQDSAFALRDRLASLTGKPVDIDSLQGLFKVRIGPLDDQNEVHNISELMVQNNFAKPQVVYF